MPRESNDAAILRPDLGAVVDEFTAARSAGMIADRVLPLFPVSLQSSGFPVIPKEVMLKLKETARAPRSAYPSADWNWENGLFATSENGWEEPIDDRERKIYRRLFDVESVCARRAMQIIMRGREKRVADLVFNATRFTAHAVSNKWSDVTSATPIDDTRDAKRAVELQCGMTPNVLIMDPTTMDCVINCDQVVDRLKYTFPGIDIANMNMAQVARVLGVEQVLVGGGVYDSAGENLDADIARIWPSTQVMLTSIATSGDLTEACLGRTFYWLDESGDDEVNTIVESYRNETKRSDIIRVRHDSDENLLASKDKTGTIKSDIAALVSYRMTNIQ
jgi:hypothetical protein